ncbi:hypothetical protein CVT24_010270 [Panaeolus cyanescens]|uniref:Uncharacterized protein n=1 Tax=Panaeolus cyanescens TaxID=181874 RepID=A0A409X8U7_9AGAR|nr:hypothetical protein CVT24_010270 [Panaeolus cyanescens]
MSKLQIHLSDVTDVDASLSICVDGFSTIMLHCDSTSSSASPMEVDTDESNTNSEIDCGCGENQMSHYEYDGSIRQDLPGRCRRRAHADGPIGPAAAEYEMDVAGPSKGKDKEFDISIDSEISDTEVSFNQSMEVEPSRPASPELPPSNQEAMVTLDQIQANAQPRPSLPNRVKLWNISVMRARSKASTTRTAYDPYAVARNHRRYIAGSEHKKLVTIALKLSKESRRER